MLNTRFANHGCKFIRSVNLKDGRLILTDHATCTVRETPIKYQILTRTAYSRCSMFVDSISTPTPTIRRTVHRAYDGLSPFLSDSIACVLGPSTSAPASGNLTRSPSPGGDSRTWKGWKVRSVKFSPEIRLVFI